MKQIFSFVIACLAVFRLTQLFTKEDGPYNIFSRFRFWTVKHSGESSTRQTFSDAIHCPYCLSVWIAFFIFLLPEKIRYVFAIAGVVSLLENHVQEDF